MHLVFDGHNDVLLRLWRRQNDNHDVLTEFAEGSPVGHIDLPRARIGGLAGGLCAIYVPSSDIRLKEPDAAGRYTTPLSPALPRSPSLDITLSMARLAIRMQAAGLWTLCTSTEQIRSCFEEGRFAAVMHIEGCEGIDPDFDSLHVLHSAGLRSLGPVWSRTNIFGYGVPFAYPMSPDTGPGLTDAGKRLVRECNSLGIMIDLSHITEKGFWDVAELSDSPLVASHSNAHVLTPVARNLTDKQLDAIRASHGLVGLNFAVTMLRTDGRENGETPLDAMVHHVDHLVEKLGIEGVALGSDYDGALIPREIGDAAGLQNLVQALAKAGYGDEDLKMICRDNWLRVLGEAWHESAG